jgi:ParE toxin of type II toxin-antitoxin system, parDE
MSGLGIDEATSERPKTCRWPTGSFVSLRPKPFVLTTAAEADVRDIIRYTRKNWGDAQVRRYLADLEQCAESLATGERRLSSA